MPYFSLTQSTGLVGHDGWYDGYLGDWQNSSFNMTDWTAIHDFLPVNGAKATIVALARKLAHESVLHVQNGIKQAVKYHKNIVVVTHVPPFAEAHVHEGKPGEPGIMPFYTSKMMGDLLMGASKAYPNVNFNVFAGHTHGKVDLKITPNLSVHVGGAEYGSPVLQGLVDVA
jgi:hypothetical protein